MTALVIVLAVVAYVVCGIINAKGTFAYFQKEFSLIAAESRRHDLAFALILGGLIWPISLLPILIATGLYKHGFSVRRK